mgnify:CR=1 FL=1
MPTTDPKKTMDMSKILRVYSGSSNRPLAEKIANILGVSSPDSRSSSSPTARSTPAMTRPSAAPTSSSSNPWPAAT